jgi:uncharacterized membrane protein
MSQSRPGIGQSSLSFERVVFFSDAVFAIVITLLVLPLTAEIELPESTTDLAHQVLELWPKVVSFVVSFLVIGQFWIAHHRMFGALAGYDTGLIWLNLICLLTVSFMPFPTALLGAYSSDTDQLPVVLYAVSMTVTSLALTVMWQYAMRRGLLVDDLHPAMQREVTRRSFVTLGIFALSIGAAFLGLAAAAVFWLILLPVARILLRARRPSVVSAA